MRTVYLNIGSNLGDRMALIERAVVGIERAFGCPARRSAPVESEPWGYESDNAFINVGVAVESELQPDEVLARVLAVQRSIDDSSHRDAAGGYADRAIDIDLIAVDDVVMDTPVLTLPHRAMHLRRFVLEPMAELAPEWVHPLSGLTAAELLARL